MRLAVRDSAFAAGRFLAAACCAALAACATDLPLDSAPPSVSHIVEKNFALDQPRSAFVGDAIVRVKDYFITRSPQTVWRADRPFQIEGLLSNITLPAGDYPIVGRKEINGRTYDLVRYPEMPLLVDETGRVSKVMNMIENAAADVTTVPPNFRMSGQRSDRVESQRGYTNYELIYTGVTGDTIRISYREYSPDDLARTAFFQELTYSKAQRTIRFRDIVVEVDRATNEAISYKVVSMGGATQ